MLMLERLAREVVARWDHGDLAQAMHALDQRLQEVAEDRVRHRGLIERAIGLYQSDDIAIDLEGTFISESEEGAFVMGWLWMSAHDRDVADATMRPEGGADPP